MDARSGDARVPRGWAQRTRLLRHSAIADALDKIPEPPPPPPRRVAGHRASRRRDELAAAAHVEPRVRPHVEAHVEAHAETSAAPHVEPAVELAPARRPEAVPPPGAVDDLSPLTRVEADDRPLRPTVRWAVIAICAVAALAAAALTGFLLTHHSTKPAAKPPTASAPNAIAQAERWIRANLARTRMLQSDPAVSAGLRGDGYTAATTFVAVDDHSGGSVLVTTPAIRDRVTSGLAGAAAGIAALPVAKFGTGAERVDVSVLVRGRASDLPDRVSREATERAAADQGLLTNPRVTTPTAVRPWLTAGRLDLRAATTLALLAARAEVRISGITLDAAEAAAGRPARTVLLSTDGAALSEVLRTLPTSFVPARVSTLPSGPRQLTWPVGLAPTGL